MAVPTKIKELIKANENKQWTASKFVPSNTGYKYGEEYKANGVPVFALIWMNFATKPDYIIL